MTVRRQHDVLVDLARRPSLHAGRLSAALREITAAAAETLVVERVGVWFFTPDRQAVRCSDLYERTPALHSEGGELTAMRYPVYFKALESERTIAAYDARLDPRTSAFTTTYLDPHGVTSMLDAPIRRLGHIAGVVCFEHIGTPRAWSSDDEHFASSVADLAAMAIDASDRRLAQEALRHRVEFEKLVSGMSTRFANAADDEIDIAIGDALGDIGMFVGAERCHVLILDEDGLGGFGTGHSSLSYLRRFPIDRVKIDREFIAEIGKSRRSRAIVSAIVAMAHGLDLAVTAEGVETEAQVEFLREQKCEEVQGFSLRTSGAVAGLTEVHYFHG